MRAPSAAAGLTQPGQLVPGKGAGAFAAWLAKQPKPPQMPGPGSMAPAVGAAESVPGTIAEFAPDTIAKAPGLLSRVGMSPVGSVLSKVLSNPIARFAGGPAGAALMSALPSHDIEAPASEVLGRPDLYAPGGQMSGQTPTQGDGDGDSDDLQPGSQDTDNDGGILQGTPDQDSDVVQQGDTLTGMIAKHFGIDPKSSQAIKLAGMIAAAGGFNPDQIKPGQLIDYKQQAPSNYTGAGWGAKSSMGAINGALQDPIFQDKPDFSDALAGSNATPDLNRIRAQAALKARRMPLVPSNRPQPKD